MYTLANASDRVTIEDRGKTFEDRPLLLLTVTSNTNHANLNKIKEVHIESTNNDVGYLKNRPVIVYQGFSIHGNVSSGSNASLLLAYYLAAAEGEYVNKLLENTIILLDPSLNPDVLQRFAHWANTNKNINLNPDPNDREYNEGWPYGRTNHYWFDMNRDWLPVQLPESRARIKTFHDWQPNVLTDHHEMRTNSTFFFQPGIPSRTHPLTPKLNQELTGRIGISMQKPLTILVPYITHRKILTIFIMAKDQPFPTLMAVSAFYLNKLALEGIYKKAITEF